MRRVFSIGLVIAIQTGLLAYMIWDRVSILQSGQTVELRVEPVDPRSLFRGDYVILNYDISVLNSGKLEGDDSFAKGDTIFVELANMSDKWEAVAVYEQRPTNEASAHVFLRGRVTSVYPRSRTTAPLPDGENTTGDDSSVDAPLPSEGNEIFIDYGVESYFVPEGAGRELEDARDEHKMSVVLAVRKDGTAAIKQLIVDGEIYHEEGLF